MSLNAVAVPAAPADNTVALRAQSPGSSHLSADLPTKLRYYEACASDEHFPDFTGTTAACCLSRGIVPTVSASPAQPLQIQSC